MRQGSSGRGLYPFPLWRAQSVAQHLRVFALQSWLQIRLASQRAPSPPEASGKVQWAGFPGTGYFPYQVAVLGDLASWMTRYPLPSHGTPAGHIQIQVCLLSFVNCQAVLDPMTRLLESTRTWEKSRSCFSKREKGESRGHGRNLPDTQYRFV